MPGRRIGTQLCHVNLLKPYYERVPQDEAVPASPAPARPACSVGRVSAVYPLQSVAARVEDKLPESDTAVQKGQLKKLRISE